MPTSGGSGWVGFKEGCTDLGGSLLAASRGWLVPLPKATLPGRQQSPCNCPLGGGHRSSSCLFRVVRAPLTSPQGTALSPWFFLSFPISFAKSPFITLPSDDPI